jgi:ArsR family transcriptional regulator
MNIAEIEKIATALADKTRLKIYEQIAAKQTCCCSEIVAVRGVTPATVSHHLRILSEAGLITCRRKGKFVINEVNPRVITEFTSAVKTIGRRKNSPA